MSILATTISFIACHGGPADHFATFAESMSQNATIEIYASGPALKKFQERGVEVKRAFSIDHISAEEEDRLAEEIAKTCALASVIITDVGHQFDVKIQKALSQYAPHVLRLAYYDNPESYVPGGYSKIAAEVILVAHGVLSSRPQNPVIHGRDVRPKLPCFCFAKTWQFPSNGCLLAFDILPNNIDRCTAT